MFESTVDKFVKTVGEDIFTPVSSLAAAENSELLALVERKASKWYFGRDQHYSTEFLLKDVLLGQEAKIEIEKSEVLCSFNKTATIKINGKFSAQLKDIFSAELDDVETITMKAPIGAVTMTEVHQQSLLDELNCRKLNMKHELIKEMSCKKRRAVCVIVAVAKTTSDCVIEATLNLKVSADAKVMTVPALRRLASGEIGGEVDDNNARSLTVPAGTTLAYQALELLVDDEGNFRVMLNKRSQGAFHASLDAVDSVDYTPTKGSTSSLFQGFKNLESATCKEMLALIQNLCSNSKYLTQLMARLMNKTVQVSDEVLSVIKLMGTAADTPSDPTNVSVRALCKALRDLDQETLSIFPSLNAHLGQAIIDVLQLSESVKKISLDEKCAKVIFSDGNAAQNFLIEGLAYTRDDKCLSAPDHSQSKLRSAHISLYGLFNYQ